VLVRAAFSLAVALVVIATTRSAFAANPTASECVAASNASAELQTSHSLRAARGKLVVCASGGCPAEVRAECTRRMDQLTVAIPTVVFVVRDAAGTELSAVKVMVDDEVVAVHLDGTALALDPGSHRLTFAVAGRPPVTRDIILHEGEKDRREEIVLDAAPALPPPAAPVRTPPSAPANFTEQPPSDGGGGRRTLSFVLGGAGVAGLLVGGVFGTLSFSSWGAANKECPSHTNCSMQATQDRSNALSFATVSTAAFIAGGALLAGGLTVYLTAPKDGPASARLTLAPGAFSLRGTF
jgi:hypothetical protein